METAEVSRESGGVRSQFATQPSHQPALGSYIYLLTAMAAIGGFLFGYDTGVVSSAMLYVPQNRKLAPMSTVWQEVIVSITSGMAGVGALMAARLSDTYGRRRIIILSSVIFTTGALVCSVGLSKWVLLAGRMLLGVAIGLASMIVPIYVGESSPANIRGKLISGLVFMITFGQMASNLVAQAFSYVDPVNVGWRLMFGFAAVPGFIQFLGFLWLPESPRWLYAHRSGEECERVLCKVYNGDKKWIRYEMEEIEKARQEHLEEEAKYGGSDKSMLARILATPGVRRALFLGCAVQAFQQISGINTIMYYTGTIIRSVGVSDYHTVIWISVVTSGVNFICTLVPMHLVERVGRRPLLMASMAGTIVSLCLMGGAFYLINVDSAPTSTVAEPKTLAARLGAEGGQLLERCSGHANCDFCVTDEHCGFCPMIGESTGVCVPKRNTLNYSSTTVCDTAISALTALTVGTTKGLNQTHLTATETTCKTRFTAVPIVLMVVYLCCYSIGLGPLPWVLNAEFYPLWARSTCVSLATFSNWSFNLLIALTFLSLGQLLSKFGVFFLYAGVTTLGLVLFARALPETKGQSIDEVQHLFTKSRR